MGDNQLFNKCLIVAAYEIRLKVFFICPEESK